MKEFKSWVEENPISWVFLTGFFFPSCFWNDDVLSSLTEANPATEFTQFRCFKVWREAKNMQAQTPAEFRRTETKERIKQRKGLSFLQFPLNQVQVSTVADYSARQEFLQDAHIVWRDAYFSQVLSLYPVFLWNLLCFIVSTVLQPISPRTHPLWLLKSTSKFPGGRTQSEPVTLPKRLPLPPLECPDLVQIIFIYIINILKGFLKSVS